MRSVREDYWLSVRMRKEVYRLTTCGVCVCMFVCVLAEAEVERENKRLTRIIDDLRSDS